MMTLKSVEKDFVSMLITVPTTPDKISSVGSTGLSFTNIK